MDIEKTMAIGARVAAAVAAVALAACAGTTAPRISTEAAAVPPDCREVAWVPADDGPLGLLDQQIRDELMGAMQRKGYAVSPETADCFVYHRYSVAGTQPRRGPTVGLGVGGGSRSVGGGLGINLPIGGGARSAGLLSVDVVDAAGNRQVWGGTAELSVSGDYPTREELGVAVERLLYQFPDRR